MSSEAARVAELLRRAADELDALNQQSQPQHLIDALVALASARDGVADEVERVSVDARRHEIPLLTVAEAAGVATATVGQWSAAAGLVFGPGGAKRPRPPGWIDDASPRPTEAPSS